MMVLYTLWRNETKKKGYRAVFAAVDSVTHVTHCNHVFSCSKSTHLLTFLNICRKNYSNEYESSPSTKCVVKYNYPHTISYSSYCSLSSITCIPVSIVVHGLMMLCYNAHMEKYSSALCFQAFDPFAVILSNTTSFAVMEEFKSVKKKEKNWFKSCKQMKSIVNTFYFHLRAAWKSITIQKLAPEWFHVHALLWHCHCSIRRPHWISGQVHTATSHGWIKHSVKGGLNPNSSPYIIRQWLLGQPLLNRIEPTKRLSKHCVDRAVSLSRCKEYWI